MRLPYWHTYKSNLEVNLDILRPAIQMIKSRKNRISYDYFILFTASDENNKFHPAYKRVGIVVQ